MPKAIERDICIEQGATFDETFTWLNPDKSPVDLTGASGRMQIRQTIEDDPPLLELTDGNGRSILGGTAGTIQLLVSATDTAAITWVGGVYDLEIELASGYVRRLFKGQVTVDNEVTR